MSRIIANIIPGEGTWLVPDHAGTIGSMCRVTAAPEFMASRKLADAQPPSLLFAEPAGILLDQGRFGEFVLEPAQADEDQR